MARVVRSSAAALTAVGAVLAGLAGGAALMEACLPDLPAYSGPGDADTTAVTDSGAAVTVTTSEGGCGDGFIERAAGETCDPGPDAGEAGVPGCTADCQIDCGDGGLLGMVGTVSTGHCYFLASGHDEDEVGAACAAGGAHVVSFVSDDERDAVNEWLGATTAGYYWISLGHIPPAANKQYAALDVTEPGWSSTCTGCYASNRLAGAKTFLDICDITRSGDCVVGSPKSTEWAGIDCKASCADGGTPVLPVCEREPVGREDEPCSLDGGACLTLPSTWMAPSTSLYELSTNALTAVEATRACAARHGASGVPGHLVVFDSAQEREDLSRGLAAFTTASSPTLSYWVGLSRANDPSNFTWADSAQVSDHPLEWADGEPGTGDYVFASIDGQVGGTPFDRQLLHTADGSQALAYVCELE